MNKIRSTLGTQLRRNAGKDDLVIIFLAGHGATEKDSGSLDGDGLEKYILPHEADPKDLYSSALPMNKLARIFGRLNSERLVFFSDTCYSGASGGRTMPVQGTRANISGIFWERLSQGKGRVTAQVVRRQNSGARMGTAATRFANLVVWQKADQ